MTDQSENQGEDDLLGGSLEPEPQPSDGGRAEGGKKGMAVASVAPSSKTGSEARSHRKSAAPGQKFKAQPAAMTATACGSSLQTAIQQIRTEGDSDSKEVWEAIHLLDEIQEKGVEPDIITYNAVISACSMNAKHAPLAVALLQEMQSKQIVPDMVTYNEVLAACDVGGEADNALQLLHEMEQLFGFRTQDAFNSVISACGKARRSETAIELMDEMKALGMYADDMTHNIVLQACCAADQFEFGLERLEYMRDECIEIDLNSYDSLIGACARAKQWEPIEQLLDQMEFTATQPTVDTYRAAILGCSVGQQNMQAMYMLQRMKEKGISPDSSIVLALVAASADVEQADAWLKQLRKLDSLDGFGWLYREIVNVCQDRGWEDLVDELGEIMSANGIELAIQPPEQVEEVEAALAVKPLPSPPPPTPPVPAAPAPPPVAMAAPQRPPKSDRERCDNAVDVLKEMIAAGIKPTASSYQSAIELCCRTGQYSAVQHLLRTFAQQGGLVDRQLACSIVHDLASHGYLTVVEAIIDEFREHGFHAADDLYSAVLSATDDASSWQVSLDLLSQFNQQGNQLPVVLGLCEG